MDDEYDEEDHSQQSESDRPRKRGPFVTIGAAVKRAAAYIGQKVEDTGDSMKKTVVKIDKWAAGNRIGRYFQFKERRAKLSTEVRSGVITFLMVAYILAVNPQILGVTGGTCDPNDLCNPDEYDLRGHACLFNPTNEAAASCLSTLRMSLTTATAATSLIATFVVGFFANLPLALAPGMGINIYVAYQVVAQEIITYEQAMVAIFLEGWIFIILSMTGIRGAIMRWMPKNIAFASSVGIGLLLAFSGLRNLGVIVFDSNTLVTIGGCAQENQNPVLSVETGFSTFDSGVTPNLTDVVESSTAVYSCAGGEMRSATMWLGFAGGLLMAYLSAAHIRGSLFIGIAFITIISWIPGSGVSYLGAGSPIPGGAVRMDVFKQVVAAPSLEGTGVAWDWSALGNGHFWVVMFTFLYIDLLDCTGTLFSMATLLDDCMENDAAEAKAETYTPFLSEEKEFAGQQWAFLSDGIGIVSASLMGITPVTVYIESAGGIEDGGRTGVTAIVVAFFFFISLFFSPILASIPPYATGPALILVGVMMIAHVEEITWDDPLESIPAFLTLIIMPFTLSVAYGIIAGWVSYIALHAPFWLMRTSKSMWKERKKRRRSSEDGGGDGVAGDSPPSSDSHRSRRIVHRKVFGLDSRRHSGVSEQNLSMHGEYAMEGIELGGVPWAPHMHRSSSQGSFRGMGGPRQIFRTSGSYVVGGVGGSGHGSRSGSWNQEPNFGGSAVGNPSSPHHVARNAANIPGRGIPRTVSMGGGGGGGSSFAASAAVAVATAAATSRVLGRSKTFGTMKDARGGGGGGGHRSGGSEGAFSQLFPVDTSIYLDGADDAAAAAVQQQQQQQQQEGGDGSAAQGSFLFGSGLLNINLDDDDGGGGGDGGDGNPTMIGGATHIGYSVGGAAPEGGSPDDGSLLFGGHLLNINLDDAAADEDDDDEDEKNTPTSPIPAAAPVSSPPDSAGELPSQPSLILGSNLPHHAAMNPIDSVDLSGFCSPSTDVGSTRGGSLNSASTTTTTNATTTTTAMNRLNSSFFRSLPEEQGIHVHSLSEPSASLSFVHPDRGSSGGSGGSGSGGVVLTTTTAAAAVHGTADEIAAAQKQGPQQSSLSGESLPSEAPSQPPPPPPSEQQQPPPPPPQQQRVRFESPPKKPLARSDSAAAIRLRSMFQPDEGFDDEDLLQGGPPKATPSIKIPSSPQLTTGTSDVNSTTTDTAALQRVAVGGGAPTASSPFD